MNNPSTILSESQVIDQFLNAMLEQDIDTREEILANGKIQRFHVEGDVKGSKNGWYCLHYDERPAGSFGCNKRYAGDKFSWQPSVKSRAWSDEEKRDHRQRVIREQAEKAAAEKARHDQASQRATELWNSSVEANNEHPYLVRKGVKAHGLRVGKWELINKETGSVTLVSDKALLVPLSDRTRVIHSLQAIFPSKIGFLGRDKDYMADGPKRGLFHTIGARPLMHEGEPVFVLCEGYATGASIHECTGHLVLVCFDTSNLALVAEAINSRMLEQDKTAKILMAADNDRWTTKPVENPGIHYASAAAKLVGGVIAVPDFEDLSGEPTDFNDLHVREGAKAVADIISSALLNPPVKADEPLIKAVESNQDERVVEYSEAVNDIAAKVITQLAKVFDVSSMTALGMFCVDKSVIKRMIEGAFWSGSKSKLYLLNDAQSLNQFAAVDAYKFLVRSFGEPVGGDGIANAVSGVVTDRGMSKPQEKALWKAASTAVSNVIVDHLKYHNQRDGVEWRCDMFADSAKMELIEDKARIVLSHKAFEVAGGYDEAIIADYKQHFSRFDEFLEFLVQSRFALDRKKCYLWMLADSDWGKGFLLGVLSSLRLAVGTSTKEVEAMFEGRPVGRAPEDFKRAFALVIDEFKTVKSELKQLQSEITLSPKNQLSASVEVFAKIFLSAESVASLVTENGVEDQFANRMSIYKESGSLVSRPVYIKVGNPRYFESVLNYTAATLNRLVAEMQGMGKITAQTHAERWINEFIGRNGLDTLYERFSDSLPNVANDAIAWMLEEYKLDKNRLLKDGGRYYLPSANKALDAYLYEHFDASEVNAYRRRKPELLSLMSECGRGSYPHTLSGGRKKAVKLKQLDEGCPI